jgi:serine/threonine protein kinase
LTWAGRGKIHPSSSEQNLVRDTLLHPSLNRADWQRLSAYLDQAFELDPPARELWLTDLAKTESDIADTLRGLLAQNEALAAAGFLESGPLIALSEFTAARIGAAGERMGAYTLTRLIGEGGMSSVWLAERSDGQLKREVALKLPWADWRRMPLAERFQRERDILATLTHPNIARIYDAGVGESGQPYLAMEYVQGTSLNVYCDGLSLSVRERLLVFLQVLAAVQFAHAHLVIHRDLKPSNILVTEDRRAVLLDFGIAKLLSADAMDRADVTEAAGRSFTPDYASPEQICGQPLGTATDVYSLGVVLYELLTGERPYQLQRQSRAALEESIVSHDPLRPSQIAMNETQAAARSSTTRKLASALRGDLDTIVLKALKKSPTDRYPSVEAFAQDISNYLQSIPVTARPDSRWYRLSRFVSRHKIPVGAAAIALLAILGGAGVALWQARAAAQERDRAESLALRNGDVNDFMGMLITEAAAGDKPVTVNDMLVRSEKLIQGNAGGSSENRAAILGAIASLQYTLGDSGKATELLDQALVLVDKSKDRRLRAELSCTRALSIANLGQTDAAARAIDRESGALDSDPQVASTCLLYRHYIAKKTFDAEGALRYARLGLERFHEAARLNPGGVFQGTREGLFLEALAYGYLLNGDNGHANHYFELALDKFLQAGRGWAPDAMAIRNDWAVVDTGEGVPRHAIQLYDQMLAFIGSNDPGVRLPPAMVHNRARDLELIGRYAEASAGYELGRQLSHESKNVSMEAFCLLGLASVAMQLRDPTTAALHISQARELLGAAAPTPLLMRLNMIQARLDLADGRFDEARTRFAQFLDRKRKTPAMLEASLGKAEAELGSGKIDDAVNEAKAALEMATSLQGNQPYSNNTGLSWLMLGRALRKQGRDAEAHEAFAAAITHLSNTVEDDHPRLVQARDLASGTGGGIQ